ncbi:MAG: hypothetical protein QM831_27480 [Kofleriaceae bacterium]
MALVLLMTVVPLACVHVLVNTLIIIPVRARSWATFIFLTACGSSPAKPKPAPPVPLENHVRSCSEAAVGLEQATRSIRPPDQTIVEEMRGRCTDDHWSVDAIDCFATMHEGDLVHCAQLLPEESRHAMFTTIGGTSETAVAIARIRLSGMHVGIDACDALWTTAVNFLRCEAIPLETRAEVGPQIADSWNLPDKLPADAQAKMAQVCVSSQKTLVQQAGVAGCVLPQ